MFAALLGAAPAQAQGAVPRPEVSAAPHVLEVTDEIGRKVSVPQPVRRIISLAPSLTETIYALGAQDRLVGVTDYCDHPAEALRKAKVGGVINPNLEQVVALKPDLVLAIKSANRRETAVALERLGIALYATDPHTVDDMLRSIVRLAEILGVREQGDALVAALRLRLTELNRKLAASPLRRVLFVAWQDPLISAGRNTFIADALRWAGAESVVDTAQDWPRVSWEEVTRTEPEFLVFANDAADRTERELQSLRERPGWRNLEAVRQQRIVVISDAVERPAPRLIDAIEQLARRLHPEAFPETQEKRKEGTGDRQSRDGLLPAPFSIFHSPFSHAARASLLEIRKPAAGQVCFPRESGKVAHCEEESCACAR